MAEEIKFSVITPVYNRAGLVSTAIESVLAQEYTNWELILVDDGSTDNSAEVIKTFSDPRIKYIYQQNQERSAARNHGIRIAGGNYICFLDSDDYYLPEHLSTLAREIQKRNGFEGLIYVNGYREVGDRRFEHKFNYNEKEHPVRNIFFSFILTNGVCAHKQVFNSMLFHPEMNILEDIHLWLRILMDHPFLYIPSLTHVAVDHEGRGANNFFLEADKKHLEQYFSNIGDLFKHHGLGNFISKKEWDEFRWKRYYNFAMNNVWKKSFGESVSIMAEVIKISPGRLFSKEFIKYLRELFVYAVLK